MTALDPNADGSSQPGTPIKEAVSVHEVPATPEAPAAPAGDPATVGLPSFIVGSIALGLVLVGMVPASAVGASLPIIMAATAAGLFVATIWSANLGQSAVASVFGIFAGFWLSYAALVLGLTHNWFGITTAAATSTQELFLSSWLIIIVMLTLATLRLPLAFTAVFALIDVALVLILIGTAQASSGLVKTAGYVVLAFAAVGVYLFFNSLSLATGGRAIPLGSPVLRG
jgi:succinate-acetate transporter protein